ncbi:hypothetical protein EMIT0P253_20272 [Pseudomonas sp. IT-P253]
MQVFGKEVQEVQEVLGIWAYLFGTSRSLHRYSDSGFQSGTGRGNKSVSVCQQAAYKAASVKSACRQSLYSRVGVNRSFVREQSATPVAVVRWQWCNPRSS